MVISEDKPFRRIIYSIDLLAFLRCLQGKAYAQNLPEDVQIVAGYFSIEKQSFQLILESDSFSEVIPGYPLETKRFRFEQIIN